jgi:5-(carboxyamino)imidazole ribonucleotide mutase
MKEVLIVMGSESDYPTLREAEEVLGQFGIPFETRIASAHRTPELVAELGKAAEGLGFRVVIAGAGGAAHLPGMMAAYSELPVIGVPVPLGALQGQDALLSIVQMPRGVPVATVAIGAAANAGLLAVQMLSTSDTERGRVLRRLVREYKKELEKTVLEKAHRFSVEE